MPISMHDLTTIHSSPEAGLIPPAGQARGRLDVLIQAVAGVRI